MINSVRFSAVLDTNVIYPVIIRDLLFWFAFYDLYTPRWSKNIFEEWKDVMIRKGITEAEATKRSEKANLAFPEALVRNYESLIPHLMLPDEKDRHVLAAAIKTNAAVIVTNNLKDFPKEYLHSFRIEAKTADDFLTDIIDVNPDQAFSAFEELVLNKKTPCLDEYEVLNQMRKVGLHNTVTRLQGML